MEENEIKGGKKNNNNVSLSTMLLQGLEAPAKLVKLYQVNAWPQDSPVPNRYDFTEIAYFWSSFLEI